MEECSHRVAVGHYGDRVGAGFFVPLGVVGDFVFEPVRGPAFHPPQCFAVGWLKPLAFFGLKQANLGGQYIGSHLASPRRNLPLDNGVYLLEFRAFDTHPAQHALGGLHGTDERRRVDSVEPHTLVSQALAQRFCLFVPSFGHGGVEVCTCDDAGSDVRQ